MSKWNSRKFFVMILSNIVFVGLFILTVIAGNDVASASAILIALITAIGFFNSVYCGTNVLDKWVQKGSDK